MVLPLSAGGGPLIGALTFDTLQEKRSWPSEMVQRLTLVAQIFSNALSRKQSDEILRESEARLSLAADSAEAGIWELDCSSSLFWATERARTIFGYAPEEIISMARFEKSVYHDDLELVQNVITRSLDRHEPFNVEYRILVGDGCLKWIYSSGRPNFKPDGEPDRLMGVSIDITKRKAFETQLARNEERLISAIDIAALGFYEMVEDYHIGFLDDRMRDIIGIPSEAKAHARQFWLEHIHRDDLPYMLDVTRKVLEEGVDHFTVDYRYRHPEHGTIWLHHFSRVLKRDVSGRAIRVIGVIQDITDRKLIEEKLRESEATLRNNQKDLQRLAGGLISVKEEELRRLSRELHDELTQRLAVLAIEAGKMEQQLNKKEHPPPELEKISHIKEQLIKVSEDVHRISRQLHPTILDDLGLVRAIESECAALQLRENLVIVFRNKDVPDRITNDVSLCIYRIVQEGLKNIITHSDAERCELYLHGADNSLNLTIKDEGSGFDPVAVRSKPGLGLSSMRERMLLVQGDFTIDSQPGRGTVIRVSVPLKKSDT